MPRINPVLCVWMFGGEIKAIPVCPDTVNVPAEGVVAGVRVRTTPNVAEPGAGVGELCNKWYINIKGT